VTLPAAVHFCPNCSLRRLCINYAHGAYLQHIDLEGFSEFDAEGMRPTGAESFNGTHQNCAYLTDHATSDFSFRNASPDFFRARRS
jgi:hypothetical protein